MCIVYETKKGFLLLFWLSLSLFFFATWIRNAALNLVPASRWRAWRGRHWRGRSKGWTPLQPCRPRPPRRGRTCRSWTRCAAGSARSKYSEQTWFLLKNENYQKKIDIHNIFEGNIIHLKLFIDFCLFLFIFYFFLFIYRRRYGSTCPKSKNPLWLGWCFFYLQ